MELGAVWRVFVVVWSFLWVNDPMTSITGYILLSPVVSPAPCLLTAAWDRENWG